MTLQPGETVFLWSNLFSEAIWSGASADAGNTFSMSFEDPVGLTNVSPEPSSMVMLLTAAAVVLPRRRR